MSYVFGPAQIAVFRLRDGYWGCLCWDEDPGFYITHKPYSLTVAKGNLISVG